MRKTLIVSMAAFLVAAPVPATDGWSAATPKFPDKPLEFVVQVAAGGSSDIFARRVAQMIIGQKLVSVPITINNQAGGGGSIACNYLKGRKGNPYSLMHTGGTFISAPLRDPTVPGYKDFTPIARLTVEPISMIVRSESPFKNIKDLVEKAKKEKPGAINIGTTGVGGTQHLVLVNLEEVTGTKYNIVSFTGSNEVTASVLGGHVDVGFLQPGVAATLVKGGKIRILAVSSEKRVSSAPNAPTFREQGFDVVFNSHRGFIAAGDIPAAAKSSLVGIFEKMFKSKDFQTYVIHEGNELAFLPGDEYTKWFDSETAMWARLLKRAGFIK